MRIGADDIARLVSTYYTGTPEGEVTFGTSGHRGSSLKGTFNEAHILAISQAVSKLRSATGPIILGKDTHALSEPASITAIEVFAANGLDVILGEGYVPTPVISHAVLEWNRNHSEHLADAVILTPSHNPPEDGGFKYNPPHGGPASSGLTKAIQERARELMACGLKGVKRIPIKQALSASTTIEKDLMTPYVNDLSSVVNMDLIRNAGLKIGVDPMGGAAVHYWEPIAERYDLSIDVVNNTVDPAFAFMPLDHDGKVRMDCSSKFAMQRMVEKVEGYDIAFGNDPDVDRHGIVTKNGGLMNPNHYLAVAGKYLFEHRSEWSKDARFAKTLVSSSMIDRVAKDLGRELFEVPVGFKWFVTGLHEGTCGFAGEESAGASFLRRDGRVWTTDKDGIILGLLAAEILAATDLDPAQHYQVMTERFGKPAYVRMESPATPVQKETLARLSPHHVTASMLAGESIESKLTKAPGNDEMIGGLKVTTKNGWFAARPSGTEDLYKIYAESFLGEEHLARITMEAQSIVNQALSAGGSV
ncbi:MAG: phosphoglucomutase (alpha-D-glucose-1,6-bisphosphate-dependent) [Bacteroidota bacterium]|nr:phosphoglucomutase (alpha-D-glucose-1,6-bisphosphate-dependent) [Bacteroidota bacterium]